MKQWIERHQECIKRSGRTFLQAAVGVFTTAMTSGEYDIATWRTWLLTLAASAIAAGISAAMNLNK